jgi:hypothetical protein
MTAEKVTIIMINMAVKLIIFTELTIETMLYHHNKEDFKRFTAQII